MNDRFKEKNFQKELKEKNLEKVSDDELIT